MRLSFGGNIILVGYFVVHNEQTIEFMTQTEREKLTFLWGHFTSANNNIVLRSVAAVCLADVAFTTTHQRQRNAQNTTTTTAATTTTTTAARWRNIFGLCAHKFVY